MSLLFTTSEAEQIKEAEGLRDLALKIGQKSLADDYIEEIQDIKQTAAIRGSSCLNSFMANRSGNLPVALTVQAI